MRVSKVVGVLVSLVAVSTMLTMPAVGGVGGWHKPVGGPVLWLGFPIDGWMGVDGDDEKYVLTGHTRSPVKSPLPGSCSFPEVSPYGGEVVHAEGELGTATACARRGDIWIYDKGTGEREQLTWCGTLPRMTLRDRPEVVIDRRMIRGASAPPVRDLKQLEVPTKPTPGPLPQPRPLPHPSCVCCRPAWSPDGSMIAYERSVPPPGVPPCGCDEGSFPGFEYWVMNADGTNPHRVSGEEDSNVLGWGWSSDGKRLVYVATNQQGKDVVVTVDTAGQNRKELSNFFDPSKAGAFGTADWSPDGSQLVMFFHEPGTKMVGNEQVPGCWVRLRRVDIETDTLVDQDAPLWEQFVPREVLGCSGTAGPQECVDAGKTWPLVWTCHYPNWSPTGRYVAFLGIDWKAVEADGVDVPTMEMTSGAFRRMYERIWMVDAETKHCQMVRGTDDERWETSLTWMAPATSPDHRWAEVGPVKVSFLEVLERGLTTILNDKHPPQPPAGVQGRAVSEFFRLRTTAEYLGQVVVTISYTDAALAGADPLTIMMVRFNPGASGPIPWEVLPATVSQNTKTVRCVLPNLSVAGPYGLVVPTSH